MNIKQKIIATGTLLAGLVGLLGCERKPEIKTPTSESLYFASVPTYSGSAMAMVTGDFDKDGDLDVIVGAHYSNKGRLYLLENDGEGNFTMRQYPQAQKE